MLAEKRVLEPARERLQHRFRVAAIDGIEQRSDAAADDSVVHGHLLTVQ